MLKMEGDKVTHLVSDSSSSSLTAAMKSNQQPIPLQAPPMMMEQQPQVPMQPTPVQMEQPAPMVMQQQPKVPMQQIPTMMEQQPPVVIQQPAFALVEQPAPTVVQKQTIQEQQPSLIMEQPQPMVMQHMGPTEVQQQTNVQQSSQSFVKQEAQSFSQQTKVQSFVQQKEQEVVSPQPMQTPSDTVPSPAQILSPTPGVGLAKQREPTVPVPAAPMAAAILPKKKSEIKRKHTPARFINPLQGLLVKENDRVFFECSIDGNYYLDFITLYFEIWQSFHIVLKNIIFI